MTDNIIHYLKHDRGFASGLGLYQSLPGANRATIAYLSRTGANKSTLEHLHYDLAKLAGITPQAFNRMMAQPVTPAPAPAQAQAAQAEQAPEAALASLDVFTPVNTEGLNYVQLKSIVKELGITVPDQKKETLLAALTDYNAQKKS